MSVIPVDFGKEARESARNFARLMKLVEKNEDDILANPGMYLDMAGKRLAEYELFIQTLWEALRLPWMMSAPSLNASCELPEAMDTVTIDRRDYEAFQAVKALINSRR